MLRRELSSLMQTKSVPSEFVLAFKSKNALTEAKSFKYFEV